ncbi:MAG: antibiotic biosynthesis monooxygenase [Sphingomonadales bacterium]|nr:MAG: antibiotic biosynthesis monooxygenase [Sphingomonadales bacterium]
MTGNRIGQIVVIFVSQRSGVDAEGYAAAAAAMDALAAEQPGYCGVDHVSRDGLGVTLSYWADEASAVAWREHPEHSATREAGRALWYDWYVLHVAAIERSYRWTRA